MAFSPVKVRATPLRETCRGDYGDRGTGKKVQVKRSLIRIHLYNLHDNFHCLLHRFDRNKLITAMEVMTSRKQVRAGQSHKMKALIRRFPRGWVLSWE